MWLYVGTSETGSGTSATTPHCRCTEQYIAWHAYLVLQNLHNGRGGPGVFATELQTISDQKLRPRDEAILEKYMRDCL
jgi:hypothetical protein